MLMKLNCLIEIILKKLYINKRLFVQFMILVRIFLVWIFQIKEVCFVQLVVMVY